MAAPLEIRVRRMEPHDYTDLLVQFSQKSVVANTTQMPVPSAEDWKKRIADTCASSTVIGMVAEVAGHVVGSLTIHLKSSARARHSAVFGIAVREEYHRRGVATRLMTAMLDLSDRVLAIARMELCVFDDNAAAIALYKKFGFALEGRSEADVLRNGSYASSLHMARFRPGFVRGPSTTLSWPPVSGGSEEGITVRRMEPADAPDIAWLFDGIHAARAAMDHIPLSLGESARMVASVTADAFGLVALSGDRAVGYAVLHTAPGPRFRVRHAASCEIVVHDDYLSRCCSPLMVAALDLADSWMGLLRIVLCVHADNTPAIALWASHGFVQEAVFAAQDYRDGEYVDTVQLARLRPGYSPGKGPLG
eukprot:m.11622 g.11622  ORF g.11622 m.11622 type:complete len:364 (+) comp2644_c0_seq2:35-1126(+)